MALLLLGAGLFSAPGAAEEAHAARVAPAASAAHAAPDNPLGALGGLSFTASREPIAVSADMMEFDYRTRVLTYKGAVVVTQGDMKLESNTLTVALDQQADNRVKEVVADGSVRLSQGTRWATGGHAVFDQAQNIMKLSNNAELHDGPNEVKGDLVTVYLNEQRSEVTGGKGRVTAKLFPAGTPGADRLP